MKILELFPKKTSSSITIEIVIEKDDFSPNNQNNALILPYLEPFIIENQLKKRIIKVEGNEKTKSHKYYTFQKTDYYFYCNRNNDNTYQFYVQLTKNFWAIIVYKNL